MSQSKQSKGGIARAAALTPERRSDIGRKAVQARWANPNCKRRVNVAKQVASTWGCSEETYYRTMKALHKLQHWAEKYPAIQPTIRRVLLGEP
jgi:hypothetical protein